MVTHLIKKFVLTAACVSVISAAAMAGDISGVVKYKSGGGPASGVRISGLTSGLLGGSTRTVYSDDRGRFVLSWKSRGGLAKLYANGSVAATEIRDGESVVITIK